jgi:predicted ATPase
MTSEPASFGELLRQLRAQATFSQEELAERAGLSVRGISDLARGVHRAPHLHTVRLLTDALAVSEIDRALFLRSARPPPPHASAAFEGSRQWIRAPHPLTRLVGREGQLAAVRALLGRQDVRLITLTGAGGIGKTRLAVAVAMATASMFTDGVVFVDLAPLRDSDAVLATIATAIDIRETGPRPLAHVVAETLASRRLLLLLDNFEHLLPAAPAVTELLQAAPGVKALVTSRQPLRVRGEREISVPPLELPAPPTGAPSADAVRSEAVTLFVERAQDVRFDLTLNDDDLPAVAEIVTRLDGLPLAIELAATWSRTLTPPVLAARLERRLPLLSGGAQDAPVRHHTMRAAIAWSYDLLQPEEQALFRRLSVFVGGWTLDALAALDTPSPRSDRLEQLTRLVDQHLVQAQAAPAGDLRYDMLATIREFAHEQVIAHGEERAACERHAAIFVDLAEDVVPHLHGPQQLASLARLDAEYDNLRAAIDWSLARGSVELATRFGAHLWLFWLLRGQWTEGRTWLRRVLALRGEAPSVSAAEATFGAGNLAGIQGDLKEAERLCSTSLAQWRQLNSPSGTARALSALGIVALDTGQFERAIALQREALPLFELPRDEPWAAHAISSLGLALVQLGDLDAGLARAEEGLTRQLAFGENWATASGLVMLADVLLSKGEYRRAAALFASALERWATPNLMGFVLLPLAGLAKLASVAGCAVEAAQLVGLHDALASEASAVANPYYEQFLHGAAELASEHLGERAFAMERDAARQTVPDRITPEALRIAHELAARV